MTRITLYLIILLFIIDSCQKNNISKIPQITFVDFQPDSIKAGSGDTLYFVFKLIDGDADLGQSQSQIGPDIHYDIYLKDSRFDTGYVGYYFPEISSDVENPAKGITGVCLFKLYAINLIPRQDSIHIKYGDTLSYQFYIQDRALHKSNVLTTPSFIIKP